MLNKIEVLQGTLIALMCVVTAAVLTRGMMVVIRILTEACS